MAEILIIDDEVSIRRLLVRVLDRAGHTVHEASNGEDGLELFHQVDRMAVMDRVALIPLCYGRNVAYLREGIHGWWEFGKSSASFADLML